MSANYRNRIGFFVKGGVVFMSCFGRIIIALVIVGSCTERVVHRSWRKRTNSPSMPVGRPCRIPPWVCRHRVRGDVELVFTREPWLGLPTSYGKSASIERREGGHVYDLERLV